MKKNEYQSPKTEIFEMKTQEKLLAGSAGTETAPSTGNPIEDARAFEFDI